MKIKSRQDTQSTLEFVHHTEYDTNFNDTTITYADKYSLFNYVQEVSK